MTHYLCQVPRWAGRLGWSARRWQYGRCSARGRQRGGQDGAVSGYGRGVPAPALIGERDVDPAPVQVAQDALYQAVLLEPPDQPGQRALAQVHGAGQLLHAELVILALGQALQHLEVADPEAMAFAQLPVERAADDGMA